MTKVLSVDLATGPPRGSVARIWARPASEPGDFDDGSRYDVPRSSISRSPEARGGGIPDRLSAIAPPAMRKPPSELTT